MENPRKVLAKTKGEKIYGEKNYDLEQGYR